MSFCNELLKKKETLKSTQTVITTLEGNKYLEKKNLKGKVEMIKLSETCEGFVVDKKLDLQIVDVLSYLYLSSQDVVQDVDLLKKNGITHVLSIGIDLPVPDASCKIKFKKIELLDEPSEDVSKIIDICFEFIESARTESGKNKILVHCNAGYSRAPTVVIAYLMKKKSYSLNESFNIINQKRKISPNAGFMKYLKNLEINLKV